MAAFDTTQMHLFLIGVFTLTALALVLSVGVLAETVLRNRRVRLARHQSMRTYYGRPALHH